MQLITRTHSCWETSYTAQRDKKTNQSEAQSSTGPCAPPQEQGGSRLGTAGPPAAGTAACGRAAPRVQAQKDRRKSHRHAPLVASLGSAASLTPSPASRALPLSSGCRSSALPAPSRPPRLSSPPGERPLSSPDPAPSRPQRLTSPEERPPPSNTPPPAPGTSRKPGRPPRR